MWCNQNIFYKIQICSDWIEIYFDIIQKVIFQRFRNYEYLSNKGKLKDQACLLFFKPAHDTTYKQKKEFGTWKANQQADAPTKFIKENRDIFAN